jgi:hypothetical protein
VKDAERPGYKICDWAREVPRRRHIRAVNCTCLTEAHFVPHHIREHRCRERVKEEIGVSGSSHRQVYSMDSAYMSGTHRHDVAVRSDEREWENQPDRKQSNTKHGPSASLIRSSGLHFSIPRRRVVPSLSTPTLLSRPTDVVIAQFSKGLRNLQSLSSRDWSGGLWVLDFAEHRSKEAPMISRGFSPCPLLQPFIGWMNPVLVPRHGMQVTMGMQHIRNRRN